MKGAVELQLDAFGRLPKGQRHCLSFHQAYLHLIEDNDYSRFI